MNPGARRKAETPTHTSRSEASAFPFFNKASDMRRDSLDSAGLRWPKHDGGAAALKGKRKIFQHRDRVVPK